MTDHAWVRSDPARSRLPGEPMTETQPDPYGRFCRQCGEHGHTLAERHCSMCGVHPARHKIGEEGSGYSAMHNLTNYLCCDHFREVVGDCSQLPTFGHRDAWPEVYTEPEWLRQLDVEP